MRLMKTFLLRFYTDTEVEERCCGDIRPLEENQSFPFKNMNEFTDLLQDLVKGPLHPKAKLEDHPKPESLTS